MLEKHCPAAMCTIYLGMLLKKWQSLKIKGDRTMNLAYKVMMNQQRSYTLRQYAVICIGTNALDDYEEQTMKIIHDLEPGHKLILMTPYNARPILTEIHQSWPFWNGVCQLSISSLRLPTGAKLRRNIQKSSKG